MPKIVSERLFFQELGLEDVTEKYVSWLQDSEVNRFLEVRHTPQSLDTCKAFVTSMQSDPSQHLFGMFCRIKNIHIGNIKLGFINKYHNRGQLSLFVGDKSYWNKGYATEAVKAITKWGINDLGLDRIEAGCSELNIASKKAFLKAGYKVEGQFRQHAIIDGVRVDSFWMAILSGELIE